MSGEKEHKNKKQEANSAFQNSQSVKENDDEDEIRQQKQHVHNEKDNGGGGHKSHEGRGDHQNHHAMMVADFRKRFWVSFVLIIPIAAVILYPIGFLLPPVVGALVMSISTVIMAVNAKLLQRLETVVALLRLPETPFITDRNNFEEKPGN